MADTRWGLNLRDRDLKKVGRDNVAELLIEKAREAIHRIDLSEGAPFLQEDFALRSDPRLGEEQVRHRSGAVRRFANWKPAR